MRRAERRRRRNTTASAKTKLGQQAGERARACAGDLVSYGRDTIESTAPNRMVRLASCCVISKGREALITA